MTNNAIEPVGDPVKASGVGLTILDPKRLGLLMATGNRQQLCREVNADHLRTQAGQIPRHSTLTTGEIADTPSGEVAHERFYGRKKWILAHAMGADPTVIPLREVVIGADSHRPPPW
jgi:hypothetical protein